jgi:hypothetical protein
MVDLGPQPLGQHPKQCLRNGLDPNNHHNILCSLKRYSSSGHLCVRGVGGVELHINSTMEIVVFECSGSRPLSHHPKIGNPLGGTLEPTETEW